MPFVVYRSSAGSGKTFTLVKAYLKIAISKPENYKNILAITFTNKAANEMKERIIRYLKILSEKGEQTSDPETIVLLRQLEEELNLTGEAIRDNSGRVLELILHNYSEFAIGTIDSFVHRIVKTFAYDLNIPLNFEVELDADRLISQAVDLLISKAGTDTKLTRALIAFTLSRIEEEKYWNIDNELKKIASNLLKEEGQQFFEQLKNYDIDDFLSLNKRINGFCNNFENKLSGMAGKALGQIHKAGLDEKSLFQGKRGIYGYFLRLANEDFSKIEPNTNVIKTIQEEQWTSKSKPIELPEFLTDELSGIYGNMQVLIDHDYPEYKLLVLIKRNIYSLAVLNEIEKIIEAYREEKNMIHISEFNKRIAAIVLNEPIPFIYERLGERYRYFLIDEFQDTSLLQWQNMLPLIENALASGNYNMLVGDAKQAVYRWRSGDFEQFINLPSLPGSTENPLIGEREATLKRSYLAEELKTNFRSEAQIVRFNNEFFGSVASLIPEKYRSLYKNPVQQFNPDRNKGYVRIELFENKRKAELIEDNLEAVERIVSDIQSGESKLSDTAVLCRSNQEASRVANHLVANGYNVISSESLLLANHPKCNFLIAVLEYLNEPSEKIYQVHIITYLYMQEKIQSENISSLYEKLNGERNLGFQEFIKKLNYKVRPGFLRQLNLYDLVEETIRIFGLNQEEDAFLEQFLNVVHQFTVQHNPALQEFLQYWHENKSTFSVLSSGLEDAVQILTIHKAKGLAFNNVIYPFAIQKVRPTKANLWIKPDVEMENFLPVALVPTTKDMLKTRHQQEYEMEMNLSFIDMLNLLYVALTRSKQKLYILTTRVQPKDEISSIPELINYFLEQKERLREDVNVYEFGEFHAAKHKQKKPEKQKSYQPVSIDYHDRLILSRAAPRVWNLDQSETREEWGKLIHLILSEISYADQVEKTVHEFLIKGYFEEKDYPTILQKITGLINHTGLKRFFKKGIQVKNEAEMIDEHGSIHRPDRFVILDNETWIIDYKTGQKRPNHKQQLQQYKDIAAAMGYKNIKMLIIYIDDEIELNYLT
ncbi:MAG: UvrD-helicase domain-containing protein [Bacteroidales bacterium]|nr:UvrD-helicase domain-containing protein [Bacteroidales bacterium]MCF8350051.1 UvrD-helicase domain-containing protein [Bacteroidales bacterium]MCF8375207.1 UvrD-helicase domain-containing protein [Bacteroidales bacterium]MCF8400231.1 UvrD-helicase domain-containing protein [Bacteroidales bacterium]